MNAVGIDVSKGKSTVVILRPFGEIVVSPYEVKHTDSEITALIKRIKAVDGEARIVCYSSESKVNKGFQHKFA